MIARVSFTGITKKDNKRSTLEDHIDLHANDLKEAREIFSSWTKAGGIRGASGIFHPLNGYGDVRIKAVTEMSKTSAGVLEEVEEEDPDSTITEVVDVTDKVIPVKKQRSKSKEKEAEACSSQP
jgi:hypothetical protein